MGDYPQELVGEGLRGSSVPLCGGVGRTAKDVGEKLEAALDTVLPSEKVSDKDYFVYAAGHGDRG